MGVVMAFVNTAELRAAELELTIRAEKHSGPWSNAPATW